MSLAADTTATIIPCLRYRKAHVAIDWLCNAFGLGAVDISPAGRAAFARVRGKEERGSGRPSTPER